MNFLIYMPGAVIQGIWIYSFNRHWKKERLSRRERTNQHCHYSPRTSVPLIHSDIDGMQVRRLIVRWIERCPLHRFKSGDFGAPANLKSISLPLLSNSNFLSYGPRFSSIIVQILGLSSLWPSYSQTQRSSLGGLLSDGAPGPQPRESQTGFIRWR